MSETVEAVPVVPIHHSPAESPRKRKKVKPTVDRIVDHTATESVAVDGDPRSAPMVRRSHALDFAPDHSKIVVVELGKIRRAVLAGPDGAKQLPDGDCAHRLPAGARIEKVADGCFRSTQLSPSVDHPDTTHPTAIDAIDAFVSHFHSD